MKKTITMIFCAAGSFYGVDAQILQENFTAPWNPTGWSIQNLSQSPAGAGWFQGNGNNFPAFNGGANDYVASNFQITSSQVGATLSSWLITPTVNLVNGGVLTFATRTSTNPNTFADRLEVYMSTAGTGTNVGNTPTSLGTFSTLLVSINSALTPTGYPGAWTVYTVVISGLPSPTPGRIGFRYHVTNGGVNGTNSDYIGLDAVKYAGCQVSVNSHTICAGGPATLTAVDADPAATFTWMPGNQNSSSIVVSPGATTTYTLTYDEPQGACPVQTATVTVGSQLSVLITASSNSICAGESATLTAYSSATQYSWTTSQLTHSIVVTPNTTTTYSVGVTSNFTCFGVSGISIGVNPNPTVTAMASTTLFCAGAASASISYSASGASNYAWATPAGLITGSDFTLNVQPAIQTGLYDIVALGVDANGCADIDSTHLRVDTTPTVTIAGNTTVCANGTVSLLAGGADSYQWSGAATGALAQLNYTAGATPGVQQFTVTGTSIHGCTDTEVHAVNVLACGGGTTVGVGEKTYASTTVFPNPFTNELVVTGLNGKVVVYNMLGQAVLSTNVQLEGTINTADLPKGAYLVQAFSSEGQIIRTVRVVKN